ncbi:MAG: metal ABC transporter permease [Parcubacteria group bacterium]
MITDILELAFIQRALIAGSLIGITLSLIGVFVVLRKSAFFGDAVAHFAFTGIALGFLFSIDPILSAVVVSTLLAFGIIFIQNRAPRQSLDTLIGVFFSGAAAVGIFVIGILDGYRPDLFQFLFGDIVAVSHSDVIIALVVTLTVMVILLLTWKQLFRITFNRDMARVAGINVAFYDYLFIGLLAVVTAVSIKIIGIILVPALLVIPAAASKNISNSFSHLVVYSAVFGFISVLVGLLSSFYLDTASGATIVLAGIVIFIITFIFRKR